MEKLQGAINKITSEKEPQWYFKVAQLKKAIKAIKEQPNLTAENAIKQKFKKPEGILKKLKGNYTPMKLARIQGIGPVKASILRKKGITNVNELKKRTNLLTNAQKLGLKMHNDASKRIKYEDIQEFERKINKIAKEFKIDLVITGSYRRKEKTSGDIDILITTRNDSSEIFKKFVSVLIEKEILHKEHLSFGTKKWLGYGLVGTPERYARIDLLFTSQKQLPFALLYFTGSQEFNEGMRAHAKKLGYSLNEYELKNVNRTFKEEKDIFQFLGLEYVPPEERKAFRKEQNNNQEMISPMLAVETVPSDITGWYMSEKLDGIRALWNGSVLYSRTKKVFHAPQWFKDALPKVKEHLDGELYIGRAKFEETQSIVMKKVPIDEEWKRITFMCFDIVNDKVFEERYKLYSKLKTNRHFKVVEQEKVTSQKQFEGKFASITKKKGEGVMLRDPKSKYEQKRSKSLVKVKPKRDAEAIVVRIEKGKGRLQNMMGKLVVKNKDTGIEFKIGTGFSDVNRRRNWKPGEVITYIYRDATAKGVPRFASYKALKV